MYLYSAQFLTYNQTKTNVLSSAVP